MRELSLTALVPATALARKGFYALGRSDVYTNNYKNCHTVKAYRTGSDVRDRDIVNSIISFLDGAGYKGITSKLTDKLRFGHMPGAIIIRIPK